MAVKRGEERTAVQLKIHQLNARLDRLTDAFLDSALDRELFESRERALILERKDLQERYGDLASDDPPVRIKLTEFLKLAKTASLSYQSGNLYEKRDLLKSVTSNLAVDRKNVVTKLRKPFEALANRAKNSDGGPCRNESRTELWKILDVLNNDDPSDQAA